MANCTETNTDSAEYPPGMRKGLTIRPAAADDIPAVYALRFEVFVDEQQVPPEIELDEDDARALHILAESDGMVVGCARLIIEGDSGHIGRLAVKKAYRGRGIGAMICRCIMNDCRSKGCTHMWLHAQLQAAAFYEKLGFLPQGETFFEAGIEHIHMEIRENRTTPPAPAPRKDCL